MMSLAFCSALSSDCFAADVTDGDPAILGKFAGGFYHLLTALLAEVGQADAMSLPSTEGLDRGWRLDAFLNRVNVEASHGWITRVRISGVVMAASSLRRILPSYASMLMFSTRAGEACRCGRRRVRPTTSSLFAFSSVFRRMSSLACSQSGRRRRWEGKLP